MFRITEVVKQLLIINGLFFVAKLAFDEGIFDIIDMDLLALFYPESENFRPYQIVTHFFMHGSFCLLYTSPSPRDATLSRMPSSA